MSAPSVHGPARIWISASILVVLALHLVPIGQQLYTGHQTLWPIMAWGMYRMSHGPPVQVVRRDVFAEGTSGERFPIDSWDVGLGSSAFSRVYRYPLATGDSTAALKLAEAIARQIEEPVARLIVEETTFTLVDGELVLERLAPVVYDVDSLLDLPVQ